MLFRLHLGLMLVFAVFITSVIPSNVQAASMQDYSKEERLNQIFEKFDYALNVEWDQQDPKFLKKIERDFYKALKASGANSEEVQGFMMKSLLDGKAGYEISNIINAMKSQKLGAEEASSLMSQLLEKNYVEGTNFVGKGVKVGHWKTVVVVIAIVVIVKVIMQDDHHHHGHHDHY